MPTNLFNLTSRVAFVTGGAGLLGQRFCRALCECGARVAVVDVRQSDAADVAATLHRDGFEARGYGCDVSDPASVTQAVADVLRDFGTIDILHNNAAARPNDDRLFAPFEEYPLDLWRSIMAVNIDGMFLVAQAVGRHMKQRQTGVVVQTSSIYGIMAPDQRIYEGSEYMGRAINTPAVYAASKSAIVGLTRYLATYWAPDNIRVNCLVPGGVQSGQNETFVTRYSSRVPLNRMAQPDEMTGALLYLVSDASTYVTGQVLAVDGGLSAW